MSIAFVVQLISILVALGSAFAVIYQGGRLVGRIETSHEEIRKAIAAWEEDREALGQIPVHHQRIGTLEEGTKHISTRLEMAWAKIFSHDRHIAVVKRDVSHHEIELNRDDDSDPPPKG